MKKLTSAAALTIAMTGVTIGTAEARNYPHTPGIKQSATLTDSPNHKAPWVLPKGYRQKIVQDELGKKCSINVYGDGLNDWHDMNTVNETGRQKGRYLYTTHEVRLGETPELYPAGGAVTVTDLKTCKSAIIAQDPSYTALDGIRWTPWGTLLFAEESDGGRLFEIIIDKKNPMKGKVVPRPAVGLMAHEGIEVGPDGSVYVVDEQRGQSEGEAGGGIYRFVPKKKGNLSKGTLYALSVEGQTTEGEGVGKARWVKVNPKQVRESGLAAGATSYERPEDLEMIGNVLYAAITEGTKNAAGEENYDGRVLAIDTKSMQVSDYVRGGLNAPVESGDPGEAGYTTGFDSPDNLATGPDGNLWIVEDNVPSDIWATQSNSHGMLAKQVTLFASLSDSEAEGTGLYGWGGKLYVNVQHSVRPDGDATYVITKGKKDKH